MEGYARENSLYIYFIGTFVFLSIRLRVAYLSINGANTF